MSSPFAVLSSEQLLLMLVIHLFSICSYPLYVLYV